MYADKRQNHSLSWIEHWIDTHVPKFDIALTTDVYRTQRLSSSFFFCQTRSSRPKSPASFFTPNVVSSFVFFLGSLTHTNNAAPSLALFGGHYPTGGWSASVGRSRPPPARIPCWHCVMQSSGCSARPGVSPVTSPAYITYVTNNTFPRGCWSRTKCTHTVHDAGPLVCRVVHLVVRGTASEGWDRVVPERFTGT